MSYAEASSHSRIIGNIQFRGNVVYGFWIVSAAIKLLLFTYDYVFNE